MHARLLQQCLAIWTNSGQNTLSSLVFFSNCLTTAKCNDALNVLPKSATRTYEGQRKFIQNIRKSTLREVAAFPEMRAKPTNLAELFFKSGRWWSSQGSNCEPLTCNSANKPTEPQVFYFCGVQKQSSGMKWVNLKKTHSHS